MPSDYGTPEEREAALRVCVACRELNSALREAGRLGITIEISSSFTWSAASPFFQIDKMVRCTRILPTATESA